LQTIIEKVGKDGTVIAIDQDKKTIEYLLSRYERERVVKVVRGNYKFIENIAKRFDVVGKVDGVLLDLGFSLDEIQESGRGFSFDDDQSLDMRYGRGEHGEWLCDCHTSAAEISNDKFQTTNKCQILNSSIHTGGFVSAEDVVNAYREEALADLFWKFGDESRSRSFAKKIVEYRKRKHIESAFELAYVIGDARPTPDGYRVLSERTHAHRASHGESRRDIGIPRGTIHPATKTFMALRIFVNREFENIEAGLAGALNVLHTGGKCVILTFHSGEDRIVKKFIKGKKEEGTIAELTKHAIQPTRIEVLSNRLSRSAKLRAFEKK